MSEASGKTKTSPQALALFEKGNEALTRNNYDYAVNMFHSALKLDPGNIGFRQALRGAERKKFDNDANNVGRMAKTKAWKARPGMLSKSRGKPDEVLDQCEEVFKINPWDIPATEAAAEAASQLGLLDLAVWFMESVSAQGGEDPSFLRHLAQVYESNKRWERAIQCWERIHKLSPSDEEARRKIKGLTANATITRAGLEDALNKYPGGSSGPSSDEDVSDPEELKRQALNPEERLNKQIQDDPSRAGPYLELAELLKQQQKLDEAEKTLASARQATGDDPIVRDAYADIQMARLQRAQSAYAKKVRDDAHDLDAKDKLEQVNAKLQEYELKEFQRRVERLPDDNAMRVQYGLRLFKAGRTDAAIAEFQQARNSGSNPLKLQALYQLGLCFEAKNLPKLAERNYQEALKLIGHDGDPGLINALHYRLGRAAESHGDVRTAEEHYNEVAANDYTYEDVAQRLENLNR